jgi:hypothetical protein
VKEDGHPDSAGTLDLMLDEETERWRQMAGVVEKLLAEEQ